MCGRINQHMFEKLHHTAIEHIKKHSMDDCSRKAEDFERPLSKLGGDRMQIEKAQIGGTPYLGKKTVLDKKVTKVKIMTEPVLVDTEFEQADGTVKKAKRLECTCKTQVDDPKEVIWQMNATTQNHLIDKHGGDTAKWIGLEIDIAVKQAGNAQPGIYPKDCSLERVIQ